MNELKAHCRGTDWVNRLITNKSTIRQASVISLYIEINEDNNNLTPLFSKQSMIQKHTV